MNNKIEIYTKIRQRALALGWSGDAVTLGMDIESADLKFKIRLEDWLTADDFSFLHDIIGITNNINRTCYPATDFGFFVPRFAGTIK